MGKTGRLYSPEFKQEAVRLVHSCDEKYLVAKIARDLDGVPIERFPCDEQRVRRGR